MTEILYNSYTIIDLDTFDFGIDFKQEIVFDKLMPWLEFKICDVNTNEIVALETEGELHVRGYSVTKAYWNDSEISKSTIDNDGW